MSPLTNPSASAMFIDPISSARPTTLPNTKNSSSQKIAKNYYKIKELSQQVSTETTEELHHKTSRNCEEETAGAIPKIEGDSLMSSISTFNLNYS